MQPKRRGWLREAMPATAEAVDAVRAAFCETAAESASLDALIQAGLRGEANAFHAIEGERSVGRAFEFKEQFVLTATGWRQRCGD